MGQEPRIGVLLCQCGGNISDYVDLDVVRENISKMEGVVATEIDTHWCSAPAADKIKQLIKEKDLNRVIVAACTINMHQDHFREVIGEVGLNPYLLERVNAREHCSWVHSTDKEEATKKEISLVRGAVERAKELSELSHIKEKVSKDVVVIGGGISGIQTSLELAAGGYKVHLVEKSPTIGGLMAKYPKVLPSMDCASCILTPRMAAVQTDKNIELLTYSEVKELSGFPGNYKVTIVKKPRYVDESKCTGCSSCIQVCPVKIPNDWDEGISKKKAIYISFPEAVPMAATIDENACLKIKLEKPGGKPVCGKCLEVCPAQAIDFNMKPETIEINAGAIIATIGADIFDARLKPEYGYGIYKNVITNIEFERYTNIDNKVPTKGMLINPLTGEKPKVVAFIQCVGCRDTKFYEYCCRVGCVVALKHAMYLKEFQSKDIDIYVCYNDLRAVGKGFEEFYRRVREMGVKFIRGLPSEIKQKPDGTLTFNVFDATTNTLYEVNPDVVVLATGLVPSKDINKLSEILKIPIGPDGFLLEAHEKLRPVDTFRDGIFIAGTCSGPKDIRDSTSDALATASKVMSLLATGEIIKEPIAPFLSDPEKCDECGACVEICPQDAISIEGEFKINPILCNACGLCVSACPKHALGLRNYTKEQLRAQIRGIVSEDPEEKKILVFADSYLAYACLDIAGLSRLTYPTSIRLIRLPSNGRLTFEDVLYAFAQGAHGVAVLESNFAGPLGETHNKVAERIKEWGDKLEDHNIASTRFFSTQLFVPDYEKICATFKTLDGLVEAEGPIEPEVREELLKNFD